MVSKFIGTKTKKFITKIVTQQSAANGARTSVREFFKSVAKGYVKTNNQILVKG